MKIGVIGTINRDSITLADGTRKEGWGGILYNLVTLSNLIGKEAEIIPICNVGKNHYNEIMALLKKLPGVNTEYINKVPENNNHCFLTYLDTENKHEILKGGVRPLVFNNIKPLIDCDYILVNFISGRDIHLSSLKKLRKHCRGKIYIDVHSYTLGRRKDGSRFIRRPRLWPSVVDCGDYIQMNRLELAVLARNIRSENNIGDSLDDDLKTIVFQLKKRGIIIKSKLIIITDGANGCYVTGIFPQKQGILHIDIKDKKRGGNVRLYDTTGCGDCFAAGFVAGLACNMNFRSCAEAGNETGQNRMSNGRKVYSILDKNV